MPSIREQSFEVLSDTQGRVRLVIGGTGDEVVILVTRAGTGGGTTVNFKVSLNGVQTIDQTLNNPSIATAEQWVQDAVFGIVGARFQFRIHFFSINPVNATIGIWNDGVQVPAQWWL